MPDYEKIAEKFDEALKLVKEITPTYQSVNDLKSEEEDSTICQAFRKLMRSHERVAILHRF